jgi:SNF2 family DNA or RNA helicase
METDWHLRFRIPAWPHQAEEFDLHRDDDGRMLRWQMRTGKTKAAIDKACYRYETGRIDSLIVAAPNNVHANWARKELPKHVWRGLPWKAIIWDTSKSARVWWMADAEAALRFEGLLVLCVNGEALHNANFQGFLKKFIARSKAYGAVGDEIHDLSRKLSSKRSKAIRGIALYSKCDFRLGLSGTITDNSPLHAFAQYEFLSKGALGYTTTKDFEARYARMEDLYTKRGPIKTVAEFINQDELQASIARWTSVVLRSQCAGLPVLNIEPIHFELTDEQKRLYNECAGEALVRLDGGEVIPPKEGGALVIQLQRIASGYVMDEEDRLHQIVAPEDNPRMQALRSHLALYGRKTVIWCRYTEDIRLVMDACRSWGMRPVDYYGGTSKADRPKHEDAFQNDPAVGPLVGQPKACGQGLDFSTGKSIVWYSHLHGDLITRKQADERCTQVDGGEIEVSNLIALGTNDERMIDEMDDKHVISEHLTGEGLRRFLELIP